ncbi:dnaJ homolog subfamily C member 17 [Venturia canescens]|uniref:dnaJ homolog subfamily C member 17 n=1 Tax=Venturia canescens TaxID=32260 RepID=UPI001C9C147C|nr:dnaJ homolog subfamily C member 17 [Venturia canescens]
MEDLMQIDLYALIGTVAEASTKEIKTAYRKKALSCHPDKNPDNPKAAELFHQLSRALEILTDDSARAAYDKVLKARHQAKLRATQYDTKRKKLKDDLEAREEAYRQSQNPNFSSKSDEQKLKAEIERLQKEGSKQVEEEVAFVRQQIYEQLYGSKNRGNKNSAGNTRIKIKWKAAKDDPANGGYDYDTLHRILSKHGDIAVLVISTTKKGSALVEYKDADAAETAAQIELGLSHNPLTLQGLWESEKTSTKSKINFSNAPRGTGLFPSMEPTLNTRTTTFPGCSSAPNIFATQSRVSDAEFENAVLQNMRRAEERKRLIEKLEAEETS